MTKEKQYKEISKLFPSELAVGDVVEDAQFGQWEALFINTMHQGIPLWCFQNIGNQETALWGTSYVKIIRKNITLSMVLEAMNKKDIVYITSFGDDNSILLVQRFFINHKHYKWQLRKDGKDLSLYDQSEETIKFIYEVLK